MGLIVAYVFTYSYQEAECETEDCDVEHGEGPANLASRIGILAQAFHALESVHKRGKGMRREERIDRQYRVCVVEGAYRVVYTHFCRL